MGMANKTPMTALVLIPPESAWEPIQAIRRTHDRQVRRWMPHITLLYPFLPRSRFDELEPSLRRACEDTEPFEIELREFRHFRHGPQGFTLWLSPEPGECLGALHARLLAAVPECDDTTRFPAGFTPHLSVGQVRGADRSALLETELQETWTPLSFEATEVCLVWRREPPDDVFRVDRRIPLGESGR
jgi:2'-5' RNA ligase